MKHRCMSPQFRSVVSLSRADRNPEGPKPRGGSGVGAPAAAVDVVARSDRDGANDPLRGYSYLARLSAEAKDANLHGPGRSLL